MIIVRTHTLQKSDMFTLQLERQRDSEPRVSAALCKSERTLKGRNGASSRALANQTLVVESLNITTSKISAAMRLACTTVKRFNTAQLSLTNYVPATTNHRKHGCNKIFLTAWHDFSYKLNFCLMDQDSLETECLICWHAFRSREKKEMLHGYLTEALAKAAGKNKGPFIEERNQGYTALCKN